METALAETRIHNLVNNHALVLQGERPLYIAGVDYPMQREQFQLLQEAYTAMAMEDIPSDAVKILLAHHPDFVKTATKYNTDLVLSGHTHGGQLGYVHCGNGSWFPFRLGCPPEIAIFHLKNK